VPPPNIIPDIEVFYFDIEVVTSILVVNEGLIGAASSEYRIPYRSFLLRYRSHDFDIEVYDIPIQRNLRKMTSISL
jgi:hypothetical protein